MTKSMIYVRDLAFLLVSLLSSGVLFVLKLNLGRPTPRRALIGSLTLGLMFSGCEDSVSPKIEREGSTAPDQMVITMDQSPNLDFGLIPDALPEPADLEVSQDAEVIPDMRPAVEPPLVPAVVVIKLGSEQTKAGVENRLSCLVYAQNGQVIPLDPAWGAPRFDLRPLEGWTWSDEEGGLAIAERMGTYEAECHFPSLGLRSNEALWSVVPNDPTQVVTRVNQREVEAGEVVEAWCSAFDAYENPVSLSDLTWRLEPALIDIAETEPDRVVFEPTQAGEYRVTCASLNAMEATSVSDVVRVTPGLPAALTANLVGGRNVFYVGDLIELSTEVRDQYNNLVAGVEVELTSSAALSPFSERRFYAEMSGNYVIQARVLGPTLNDLALSLSRFVIVEDGAPQVTCTRPVLGDQTTMFSQTVEGRVRDLSEITSLTVNGVDTALDAAGNFSATVRPTWGLNVIEIIAEDAFGAETLERCMFFASNTYLNEDDAIIDVALLHLSQDAIDDGAPRLPIGSLGDLLANMLNSDELIDTIDDALTAQNPIVPTECYLSVFGCVFSAGARYESLTVRGSNTITLQLTSNGFRADATIRNVEVGLRTTGSINQSGTVSLSSARVIAEFNLSLSNGVPQVSVRGIPTITLGNIDLNLNINSSVAGWVINAVLNTILGAFEGLIRDELSGALEGFITSEIDAILSGALNSLDLNSLGLSLSLPRPFGSGSYQLGLAFAFNRINVSSERLRIGLSSVISGSKTQALPLDGVPSPSGIRRVELTPGLTGDAAGSAHVTLVNSILTRLWRGRFFDVTTLGAGSEADLALELLIPPALELDDRGDEATLHFGPAVAEVNIPALFDEPITLNIGGRATTSITLNRDDTLNFGQIALDQLFLSSPGFSMSVEASAAVETLLIDIVQSLLDEALNNALPSFPIPDFALPNSLSVYGVPRDTRLGVRDLTLSQDGARLLVRGDLR